MPTKRRFWSRAGVIPTLAVIAMAAAPMARADLMTDGSFENVTPSLTFNNICSSSVAYSFCACTATDWSGTYQIASGSSAFGIPQPDPDGVDVAVLQSLANGTTPSLSQVIDFGSSSSFTLDFFLLNRGGYNPQTVTVELDGTPITGGSFTPGTVWEEDAVTFSTTAGDHTLTFVGSTEDVDDQTAFLDDVTLNSAPEPSSLMLMGTGLLAGFVGLIRRKKA
jgi:hypothetical protein